LIDLALLRTPTFAASLARYMVATLVTFGSYFVVAQYLQLVAGLSPLVAGLWMLPWSVSYVVGSFLAPLLARRASPALVMAGGLVVAACGFVAVAVALAAGLGVGAVIVGSTVYSLGMSPVFTLGIDSILAAAPARRAGAASGLAETCSELGGALGIAVLGSLGTAIYRGHFSDTTLAGVPMAARQAAIETLGGAVAAATPLTPPAQEKLLGTARLAFTHATQATLALCAALALATAVGSVVARRRARSRVPTTARAVAGPGGAPS